ncbi:MAG TPA: GNAT family N-acetyltransferase [Anaerolineae bacterium]|nr:GNAT family N-acetyltransferase [Anaerolineae bacterium]HQK15142.1 GNAT family N-acetyltransferase [Anaerolineae bacterium]
MNTHLKTTNEITIFNAPAINGLVFRGFRGPEDYPAMVAVIEGSKKADQLERAITVEDIARDYNHLINSDPYRDMLFVEMHGEVIGYSRVYWFKLDDGTYTYGHFANLLPAWRKLGIRRAMLRHNERRLREIAMGHANGNGHDCAGRHFECWASKTETDWRALLTEEGYTPVRYGYLMVRPDLENIPDLPLPAGLEVRPVRPEDYLTIWYASKEAFRDHWGYTEDEWDETNLRNWQESHTFTPALWQVAWDGDEVAGMVLNYIDVQENTVYNRKRGYTENICVRRPWRRQGLARALLARSLAVLKAQGMTEAALGVDALNPNGALQLYKSMGFCPVKEDTAFHKPLV